MSAVGETLARFQELDTIPVGINPDDAASHLAFVEHLALPFDLLVDEGLAISTAYDALKVDGSGILRTVVVVGKNGRVIFRDLGAPLPGNILQAIRSVDDSEDASS